MKTINTAIQIVGGIIVVLIFFTFITFLWFREWDLWQILGVEIIALYACFFLDDKTKDHEEKI